VNAARPREDTFASLRTTDTATLIAAAADVALLLDEKGVIRDVTVGSQEFDGLGHTDWIGRTWADIVTVESRPKVEALLRNPSAMSGTKWRHINHADRRGTSVPVLYATVPAGQPGQVLAIGRDLRQFTAIQQRLVNAQQSMQRDYARLRQIEMRYRALFDVVTEPILIVDGATLRIAEANPAAARMFGENARRLQGRTLADCFETAHRPTLLSMLETVRSGKAAEPVALSLAHAPGQHTEASATVFRPDTGVLFLVRLGQPQGAPAAGTGNSPTQGAVLEAIENAPDGLVVTDSAGGILYANASFAELAQMDSSEQLVGESLERWLGRSGVDLGVLMANLRRHEAVRLFPSVIRGRFGVETSVEISAAAAADGKHSCLGFAIRDVSRRLGVGGPSSPRMSRSVGQLAELVGQVPLRDIVGETTDLIERMCIETALQLTRDNRAAAAEMLGLSRQSLYVKLRRFGLGDAAAGDPGPGLEP
jgi:transcriptional regulator PpsR